MKLKELLALYDDIVELEDYQVVCKLDNLLYGIYDIIIDNENNQIILNNDDGTNDSVMLVEPSCRNCRLLLENNICEYYNTEVVTDNVCSEWIYNGE